MRTPACPPRSGLGFEPWALALRQAIRGLWRAPAFSVAVVGSLLVCIGPNAAILSALYALVVKPLPFPDASQLVTVVNIADKSGGQLLQGSTPQFLDFKEHADLFSATAGGRRDTVILDDDNAPTRITNLSVCGEFFGLLGVQPLAGRLLGREDEVAGRERVLVVSDSFWRSKFNRDETVLGRTIRLNGQPYTVVGVAPADVETLCPQVAFFAPYVPPRSKYDPQSRYRGDLTIYGRLKPGVSAEAAQAQLASLETAFLAHLASAQVKAFVANSGMRVMLAPARPGGIVAGTNALWLLQGGALLVLLIGGVNVANLFLARMNARRAELAVRVALGAGQLALWRHILAECLVLTGIAACAGLGLAALGLKLLNLYLPVLIPGAPEVAIDVAAMATILGGALVLAVLVSVLPLQVLWRGGVRLAASRTSSSAVRTRAVSGLLVTSQIAVAVMLLIGAGLMIRSFSKVLKIDPGFDVAQVMRARLDFPRSYAPTRPLEERYRDPAASANVGLQRRILESISGIPGVANVATSQEYILMPNARPVPFSLRNGPERDAASHPVIHLVAVSPEFFATMGMRIRSGRSFNGGDDFSKAPVAIVDETFVQRYFPGQKVEGREIYLSRGLPLAVDGWPRIVGVVNRANLAGLDSHDNLPIVFVPTVGFPVSGCEVLVRSTRASADLVSELRARLREIDPGIVLHSAQSLQEGIDRLLLPRRGITVLLGAFSVLALLLAAIGLYGMLSYDVTQRTREIGIRGAIGATRGQIVGLILRQGLAKTVAGLVVGLGAAMFLTRYLEAFLFGIPAADPAAYAAVIIVLAVVSLLACWWPARRASRLDPMVALRSE